MVRSHEMIDTTKSIVTSDSSFLVFSNKDTFFIFVAKRQANLTCYWFWDVTLLLIIDHKKGIYWSVLQNIKLVIFVQYILKEKYCI